MSEERRELAPDARISPLTRSIVRYLIDGEWHPVELVVQKITPKVHPGKAARQAERTRRNAHGPLYPSPEKRQKNTEEDRIHRIGSRQLIKQTLRNTLFERSDDGLSVRIRPYKLDALKKLMERLAREGGEAAFRDY